MPKEERAASDTKQTTFEDVINTSEGEAAEDGSYELVVKAQDNAGNVSEPYFILRSLSILKHRSSADLISCQRIM